MPSYTSWVKLILIKLFSVFALFLISSAKLILWDFHFQKSKRDMENQIASYLRTHNWEATFSFRRKKMKIEYFLMPDPFQFQFSCRSKLFFREKKLKNSSPVYLISATLLSAILRHIQNIDPLTGDSWGDGHIWGGFECASIWDTHICPCCRRNNQKCVNGKKIFIGFMRASSVSAKFFDIVGQ